MKKKIPGKTTKQEHQYQQQIKSNKAKALHRDKKQYVIVKGKDSPNRYSNHEYYVPYSIIAPKIHKAKLTELQKEADKSIIRVGDYNLLYQNLVLQTKITLGIENLYNTVSSLI